MIKNKIVVLPQLLMAVAVCLISGCGGGNGLETAPVTGKVMYQGKPLPYGTISFQPQAGSPATGKIQPDGTFVLGTYGDRDGAIVGINKVLITATEIDAGAAPEADPNTEMQVPKSVIPTKYGSFSTSGLTAEVSQGENDFTFELTGDPPANRETYQRI